MLHRFAIRAGDNFHAIKGGLTITDIFINCKMKKYQAQFPVIREVIT